MYIKSEEVVERFNYVKSRLGAVAAFGDSIGENVSKPQLAIALERVKVLEEQFWQMRGDLEDCYRALSRDLHPDSPLLCNVKASLGYEINPW